MQQPWSQHGGERQQALFGRVELHSGATAGKRPRAMASSRRPRATSLTLGLMSSSPDQRLADLEAGETEALNNAASQTYVELVGHGLTNSWTPNSVVVPGPVDLHAQYTP